MTSRTQSYIGGVALRNKSEFRVEALRRVDSAAGWQPDILALPRDYLGDKKTPILDVAAARLGYPG